MRARRSDHHHGADVFIRNQIVMVVVRFRDSVLPGELYGAFRLQVGYRHQVRVGDALSEIFRIYRPESPQPNDSDV